MFKRLLTVSVIFGMAATAPPVLAASCGNRTNMVQQLESQYSEHLSAGGLQMGDVANSVVELWVSKETGTFTVLLTQANGISCIMAAGTDYFEALPLQHPKGTAS